LTTAQRIAVYVSNAESGDIVVFALDAASGELTLVQRVMVGGAVMPLAISPDRRFLYAARRTAPLEVVSFAISAASGELSLIGAAPLIGNMVYIATDRSGRFLLCASYSDDLVATYPIAANGVVLADACEVVRTGRHAHAVQCDPSNRYVFVAVLGEGVVLQRQFDALTGATAAGACAEFASRQGAGPRHFVFHPGGRHLHVLNELDGSVDTFELEPSSGTLTCIQTVDGMPPSFEGAPWAADLRITSDGRFLYTSERRSNTLAAFAVDARTACLTSIGHWPGPEQPRSLAIAPGDRFLLAIGQKDHRLCVYGIEAESGALRYLGDYAVGSAPTWIEAVLLPSA